VTPERYHRPQPFSDLSRPAYGQAGSDPLMHDPVIEPWRKPAAAQGTAPREDHIIGVGLGQPGGGAALAVLLRTAPKPATYAVVHLKRFSPDAAYHDVAAYVAEKSGRAPLLGCRCVLDGGLGPNITDVFRRERGTASLFPVLPTTEKDVIDHPDGTCHAPGAFLASAVLAVMQQGRLKVAGSLRERQQLHAGLKLFGGRAGLLTRINAIVWNTSEDDPLVHAVALALWHGEARMWGKIC
jgi:hypothetical protein